MHKFRTSTWVAIAGLPACLGPLSAAQTFASREEALEFPAEIYLPEQQQDQLSPAQAKTPPSPTPAANAELAQTAAASLARTAILDLRGINNPSPDDMAICAMLLRTAQDFAPLNTQIIRARIEAANGAGDNDELIAATRDLVRADPADTVAQLRLISNRLTQMQTAQDRVASYQQFLGPAGAKLDPSIRSRLALDAALLAREMGDQKSFVSYLKQATSLDGTNKDAAVFALSYFSESVKDRKAHFELLTNVLYADPMDPGIILQIRDELASAGAWDQAKRFHLFADAILKSQGDTSVEDRIAEYAVTWHTKSPEEVLKQLELELSTARFNQNRMFQQEVKKIDAFDMRKAEDVRLPAPIDQVRLAAALALHDNDAVANTVKDLVATYAETFGVLGDASRRPRDLTDETAHDRISSLSVELSVWRLLAEQGTDEVLKQSAELRNALSEDDDLRVILDAWTALRSGHPDEAKRIATESGVSSSWLGVAMALASESAGDRKAAASMLRAVAEDEPLTALGCWAGAKAEQLDPDFKNPLTSELDRLSRNVPLWIDSTITRPSQHQRLTVDVDKNDAKALEPVGVTLTIKNLSPIPLALGNDLPLNARMLLIPSMQTGEEEFTRRLSSEVVSLNQRLRLLPGESLSLRIDPDISSLGWVAGSCSSSPISVRYRLIQGFVAGDEGARTPGAGCLDVSSQALSRSALDFSRLSAADLATKIPTADEASVARLAVASRAIILPARMAGSVTDAHKAIIQAWTDRYPSLSPEARTVVLCELPPVGEVNAMQPFDDVVKTEANPVVLRAVLLTRVATPTDPLLDRIAAMDDPALVRLATLHRARLTAGAHAYAVEGVTGGIAAAKDQPKRN